MNTLSPVISKGTMNACNFEAFIVISSQHNVLLQGETGLVATWLKVHSVKLEGHRF
jgi:hypothetical protein